MWWTFQPSKQKQQKKRHIRGRKGGKKNKEVIVKHPERSGPRFQPKNRVKRRGRPLSPVRNAAPFRELHRMKQSRQRQKNAPEKMKEWIITRAARILGLTKFANFFKAHTIENVGHSRDKRKEGRDIGSFMQWTFDVARSAWANNRNQAPINQRRQQISSTASSRNKRSRR